MKKTRRLKLVGMEKELKSGTNFKKEEESVKNWDLLGEGNWIH